MTGTPLPQNLPHPLWHRHPLLRHQRCHHGHHRSPPLLLPNPPQKLSLIKTCHHPQLQQDQHDPTQPTPHILQTLHHLTRRRHHRRRGRSRGRTAHHTPRSTLHHTSSRRHRSSSYSYYSSYSRSPSPSRSRSRPAISLIPNTGCLQQDSTSSHPQTTYPTHPSVRRVLNKWQAPPLFHPKTPQEQLEIWMDYHAAQFDTPNKPRHTVSCLTAASLTTMCVTTDNSPTSNGIPQPTNTTFSTSTTFPFPPCHRKHTAASHLLPLEPPPQLPEIVHVHASHTGPVGNITSILQQGRFLPSTLRFSHNPGFFAQGVRITQQFQHDTSEQARIFYNTWNLAKNTHSALVSLLAWGARRRRTRYHFTPAKPWSSVPPQRQVLGHPPSQRHSERPRLVGQRHTT